jgi:hypothetical protein
MKAAVNIGDHFSVATLADHDGGRIFTEFLRIAHYDEYSLMPDCGNHFLAAFEILNNLFFILLVGHCYSHEGQIKTNEIMGKRNETEFYRKAGQLLEHSAILLSGIQFHIIRL